MAATFLAVAGSLVSSPAQAAGVAGQACPRVGMTTIDAQGRTLVCTKVKKGKHKGKLRWKVKAEPTPPPTPTVGIPAIIESWGIAVSPYDDATRMAGDLFVGTIPFPSDSVIQAPIQYYGEGPRRPQDPPDFVDPQMTFIVPQGTAVRAIISGEVCSVTYLNTGYSEDYSIGLSVPINGRPACQMDPSTGVGFGSLYTWEHEHVMQPLVEIGDHVTAGQIIATASYYSTREWLYAAGYALYEIGILAPSDGRPMHVCPALYLQPQSAAAMLTQLAVAARAYEANVGRTVYDDTPVTTGCVTERPAYG